MPAEQENEHRDAQAPADACITERSALQPQTCLNALEASCENLSSLFPDPCLCRRAEPSAVQRGCVQRLTAARVSTSALG